MFPNEADWNSSKCSWIKREQESGSEQSLQTHETSWSCDFLNCMATKKTVPYDDLKENSNANAQAGQLKLQPETHKQYKTVENERAC